MTIAAFAVTGACGVATALALRPAALAGRLILAAAGATAVLVAANPSMPEAHWDTGCGPPLPSRP